MSINRATATLARAQERPYTTLMNESIGVIKTTDALAVYTYLQSKREGWIVRRTDVMNRFGITKERYAKAFSHLVEVGLVERVSVRNQSGRLTGSDIVVHYLPVTERLENRTVGKTGRSGKPDGREIQTHSNDVIPNNNLSSSNNSSGTPTGMPCKSCNGLGVYQDSEQVCHDCQGSGAIEEQSCYICDGEQPGCATCKPDGYNRDSDEATGKQLSVYPDHIPDAGKMVSATSTDQSTTKKVKTGSSASQYPEEFEWIWKNKPARIGSNPKKKAFNACRARIKEGATWRELAEGMQRYTAHCKTEQKLNSQYVMQLATFFGPDEHFKEAWQAQQKAPDGAKAENLTNGSSEYTKAVEATQAQREAATKQISNLKGLL